MKCLCSLVLKLIYVYSVVSQLTNSPEYDFETRRIDMIVDIITRNMKTNGWCTILCFGNFPDELYKNLRNVSYPFAISNIDREDEDLEDVVPHHSNTILINLENIDQYEDTIMKIKYHPYWHPLANILLYFHQPDHEILAKIYFSLWYYKVINAIIVQYDDSQQVLIISHFTPYISDDYKLEFLYGCWTTRKTHMPLTGFEEGLQCEENCHNVSLNSKFRANNLGTCIGFNKIIVPYNNSEILTNLTFFEDQSKDLHGYVLRAYVSELKPMFVIEDNGNGTFTMLSRDGLIWNLLAKLINFTIDISSSAAEMKQAFNFELNIRYIFDFAFRKADLFLNPIYLFDLAVVELDYTFQYKESGVCIMSHRAGFETTLFDVKALKANQGLIALFIICFFCIAIVFSVYHRVEKGQINFDQIGKDFLNALRNMLLITLSNPPQRQSFRIFLTISIWSFFVLNFATQAIIISFLTAAKRGREIDTFEDVLETRYPVYGMASPDIILPDTEERFLKMNSKLVPIQDLFACVANLTYDLERFCLIDCAVGRYLERNRLNDEGEQYLHIAQKDRIHSHYLNFLLAKNSPLTDRFNKYLITFYEAGLIRKWEQYRYTDIKEEPPIKPLGMDDFESLFKVYLFALGFIFIIFINELIIFYGNRILMNLVRKHKRRND